MNRLRTGRRRYYDIFSDYYDAFIRLHSGGDKDDTRDFLVASAQLGNYSAPRILDICCGTGSVILTFKERCPESMAIGYDFSHGMLRKAREKNITCGAIFVEGDAVALPFTDGSFDVVTCSHALYEFKGESRVKALREMKRVVRPDGLVLIMEHEIPRRPVIRLLFYIRMLSMGSEDAREFIKGGLDPFKKIFSRVSLSHSSSGKSKLMSCRK
jgi:ubiquinone/menaquinone biosynthesis C-methylase UbiE